MSRGEMSIDIPIRLCCLTRLFRVTIVMSFAFPWHLLMSTVAISRRLSSWHFGSEVIVASAEEGGVIECSDPKPILIMCYVCHCDKKINIRNDQ